MCVCACVVMWSVCEVVLIPYVVGAVTGKCAGVCEYAESARVTAMLVWLQ